VASSRHVGAERLRVVSEVDAVIEYAMQTPDSTWRVEVVKRGRTRRYRVVHADNVLDWLNIAAFQQILY
jgi:bifunctional non-homologous end joining protein LigD